MYYMNYMVFYSKVMLIYFISLVGREDICSFKFVMNDIEYRRNIIVVYIDIV